MTLNPPLRLAATLVGVLTACGPNLPALEVANRVPDADPRAAGQTLFLRGTFGTEQLGQWPPADFMRALMDDEPEVFGDQFARFGFVADPDSEFPIGFARGTADKTQVHETCALCHVGRLPDGRVWLGLPSSTLDFARFRAEVDARWVAAGNPSQLGEVERSKLGAYGPGRTAADSARYPKPVPADFPPYFRLGARTHLNYMGTGQNLRTETYFSINAFGAGAPNPETAVVPLPDEAVVETFLAFLGSLEPPPPPARDPGQVAAGRAVYEREGCGDCHHVGDIAADGVVTIDTSTGARDRRPGEDPRYPRGSVTTSRAHRVLQDGDPDAPSDDDRIGDLVALILDRGLAVRRTDGYRVSLLAGLAYTAPYLHNGSVPTLEALLSPVAERPRTFERDGFVVDTSLPGNDNGGHTFGATLSAADKAALIAYLESL